MFNWFRKVAPKPVVVVEEKKKQDDDRTVRDLLRENLATIPVDVFYVDDPLMTISPDQRRNYLKYFYDLSRDKKFMSRIKFLINKQALVTLEQGREGISTVSGAMNLNGIATIKDDVERLAAMHLKESAPKEKFDKHAVI